MNDEPVAKKARVEIEPSKARGVTSSDGRSTSSSDESVEGSNREGAVVEASSVREGEHNYSITNRWRKRSETWRQWKDEKVFAKNFDLISLRLLTGQELFMRIDESSLLGKELVAFAASVQDCKRNVQDSEGEIQTFMGDIQTFEQDIQTFKGDIQTIKGEIQTFEGDIARFSRERKSLETQKKNVAVQVKTLNEQMSSMPNAAIKGRIEDKTEVIAAKTGEIAAKTALIAAIKTALIAAIKGRIEDKTALIARTKGEIEDKTALIARTKGEIAGETVKVETMTKNIDALISSISLAHEGMRNKFSYINSKGNENVVTITSTLHQSLDSRIDITKTSSPSAFNEFRPEAAATFRDELIKLVTEENKISLGLFQTFVVDLLKKADPTDDSEKVKRSTDAILAWEIETNVKIDDKNLYYARPPTTEDKETTADHPILHAVICRIIRILVAESSGSVLHEHEHGVTTEQSVAGCADGKAKRRRIDVTAYRREEYLALVLPTMVKKAIEIKAAPDSKGKFQKAVEKGRSQIFGHLGKRLLYAFDFGGAGENACAVGISLTHLSIEVIKMSLSGVGTKEVELRSIGTGLVPLLGTEVLTNPQKEEMESMEATVLVQLAGAKQPESMDTAGFVLLAGALMHELPEKFEIEETSFTQIDPAEEALTASEYLGSGAFCNVVKLGRAEFMKMPKSAALQKGLIQEAAILRKLQSTKRGCISIPRLVLDHGTGVSGIRAVVRGEISDLVGLRLKGDIGLPLHRLPRLLWTTHSKVIIDMVFKALNFAHGCSIFHMDVRPGNIIVSFEKMACHAMLTDWGCSVDGDSDDKNGNKKLKRFRGCPPYAHDRLLGVFKGTLGRELDFASLAYTLDHVCTGKLRWLFEFDRPLNVTTDDLEIRRTRVSEWLEVAGPPSGKVAELYHVLSEEKREVLRSACCSRRSPRTSSAPDRYGASNSMNLR